MRALIFLALLVASAGVWAGGVGSGVMDSPPLREPGTLTLMAAGALAASKLLREK